MKAGVPKHLRRLAAAGLVAAAAGVQADEWVIDRSVAGRYSYNDNITMRGDAKQADSFLSVTPEVGLASRTEARDLGMNLAIGGHWYQDRTEYNATDYSLGLAGKWRAELDRWNLTAGSKRDSTLQSEVAATGVVTERRQRTLNSVQADWSHAFGATWSGNVGYNVSQARYESASDLVDYDDQLLSAGLQSALSEDASLSLTYTSRDFETRNDRVRSQVDGVTLGGNWQVSERLSLGLSAGRQRTKSEQKYDGGTFIYQGNSYSYLAGTTRTTNEGSTYSGNVGYQFEQGGLSFSASRGQTASGTGTLLRTDAFGLGYSQRLDEKLSVSLGAGRTRSRQVENPDADNRYTTFSSSLNWQLDDRLTLGAGYNHALSRTGSGADVSGNLVFVNLDWKLTPLSRGW